MFNAVFEEHFYLLNIICLSRMAVLKCFKNGCFACVHSVFLPASVFQHMLSYNNCQNNIRYKKHTSVEELNHLRHYTKTSRGDMWGVYSL